ncbi:MAG: hypothetical protein KDE51_08675, partial [Anaerolineales bacterium]|nr:hypothetical protein [Anaerolineales bacterium]
DDQDKLEKPILNLLGHYCMGAQTNMEPETWQLRTYVIYEGHTVIVICFGDGKRTTHTFGR